MPVHGRELPSWFRWIAPWSTLDDDVTTGSTRLLLRLYEETGEERYRRGAERGLDLLLASQLPGGGWPLTHRPRLLRTLSPSFEDLPSLNDAATASVIQTLLLGDRILERPDLVAAARRGGDWLVAAQLPEPAPGWAQQYDENTQPVPGRAFEPVAAASWETRHAIEALLALSEVGEEQRYCQTIDSSARWLTRSALSPGCWARFLSLEDGQPIFVDARGEPVAGPGQAKRPYRWIGDFGISQVLTRLGKTPGTDETLSRISGDAGDCPGTARRSQPRSETWNPRARIGEAASQIALGHEPRPSVCPRP